VQTQGSCQEAQPCGKSFVFHQTIIEAIMNLLVTRLLWGQQGVSQHQIGFNVLALNIPPKGSCMVVIRLSRGGAKARPFFNIVVADKRNRRDGRFIERIGFYNPIATGGEESLRIALDRLSYWRGVGAQASPTVERLIKQAETKAA
jgi:small subunit ribosomal protein S16